MFQAELLASNIWMIFVCPAGNFERLFDFVTHSGTDGRAFWGATRHQRKLRALQRPSVFWGDSYKHDLHGVPLTSGENVSSASGSVPEIGVKKITLRLLHSLLG